MQIHPGLSGLLPTLRSWRVTCRSPGDRLLTAALKQTEINQHRQTVLVTPEQIAGVEITMHQLLCMQHGQR